MSVEAVRQFMQKARNDTALGVKIRAIPPGDKEAVAAAVIRVAAEAGFTFTAEEYATAAREEVARRHAAGELQSAAARPLAG